MSRKQPPKDYRLQFELASGATLDLLLFDPLEHRWIFSNRYSLPVDRAPGEKPTLINNTTLVVEYQGGIVQDLNLTLDIVRPDRKGKVYWLGLDISPGSHLNLEFLYEKQDDLFRMKTIVPGVGKRIDLDSLGEGLIRPVEFPFPLLDRIEPEFGVYRVPFLRSDETQAFFEFPRDYNSKKP